MNAQDRRDRALEVALGQLHMPGPLSEDCLDAETLAAWADGGLDQGSRAHAEAHVSDCARCQAMMAAIVSSAVDPAAAGTEVRPWWLPDIRWLVPLAGAAAAVLLWAVVPFPTANRPASVEVAQSSPSPVLEEKRANSTPPAEPGLTATTPVQATPEIDSAPRQAAPGAGNQASPARERRAAPPQLADERADQPAAKAEADLMSRAQERAEPSVGALEAVLPPPAAAAPPPPAPAAAPASPPAGFRQPAAPAPLAKATGSAVSADALGRMTSPIVSRDGSIRWRMAGAGIVERSSDAGRSWARIETGIDAVPTSGSSPSATVCWLAGRAGLVMLTTDARTWRRTAAPTTDDLVAIDATTDRAAIVRTATGASFSTVDGGATWIAQR